MGVFSWLKKAILFCLLFFLIDYGISSLLLTGLNQYFGLDSNAEILLNGSSMSLAGFDKIKIENATKKSVAFYSRNGVSLEDRSTMLKHYFNKSSKKTAIVVLEVNPLLFSKKFTAANVYRLFLPFMDDAAIDEFVKSKTTLKDYWVRKIIRTSRYDIDLFSLAVKGYMGVYENKKTQVLDANALDGLRGKANSVPVEFNAERVALFKETIELAKKSSEKIVLVNMPIFDTKMKTFKADEYQSFLSFFVDYAKNHRDFYFLDLNQQQIISNPNLFSDPLHVNVEGQTKVSEALVQFLFSNQLISERPSKQ
jgi:hypothetical protein